MTPDHDATQTNPPTPPFVKTMVAVLATLALVGAVVAVAGWWVQREPGEALARVEQRAAVTRVAEQFTVRVNNYSSESVDEYKSSVGELLSTKFQGEFDQAMEDIVVQVQQAQMESTGEVLASGVATLDDDSARVLVVADSTVKTVFDDRQRHFRWEVSLVRVDGEWLVDDFTPVA
jgi:hypothetical protein